MKITTICPNQSTTGGFPCQKCLFRDILTESRREHSRKPDQFFSMIENITLGRRLEYFSREKRNGWEVFGNDINKF